MAPSHTVPSRASRKDEDWEGVCNCFGVAMVVLVTLMIAGLLTGFGMQLWKCSAELPILKAERPGNASEAAVCMSGLELAHHQPAGGAAHRDLWALVRMAEELGRQNKYYLLCAEERSVLAYQGAQAQAALQAMGAEAGGPASDKKTLSARVQEAVQRSSAAISQAINGTMHRLAKNHMPSTVEAPA